MNTTNKVIICAVGSVLIFLIVYRLGGAGKGIFAFVLFWIAVAFFWVWKKVSDDEFQFTGSLNTQ